MAAERNDQLVAGSNSVTDARLVGLESRIEHVASATFTNLRYAPSTTSIPVQRLVFHI